MTDLTMPGLGDSVQAGIPLEPPSPPKLSVCRGKG